MPCSGTETTGYSSVAKCCKNIVGCEECVNTWYNEENAMIKTCPLCRAERGYADTMRLNGLDTFVSNILNPTDNPSTAAEQSHNGATVFTTLQQVAACTRL